MIALLFFALATFAVHIDSTSQVVYVTVQNGVCSANASPPPGGYAAMVTYTPTMNLTGWDELVVTTNSSAPDTDQAFAAGCGEGMLTVSSINYYYVNSYPSGSVPASAQKFLLDNWNYTVQSSARLSGSSAYWAQVALQVAQFEGLLAGINAKSPTQWTTLMLLELQAVGDLYDIIPALQGEQVDWRGLSKKEYASWFLRRTHCSALVKVTPNMSDLYFSHATWSNYNQLLRSYKTYSLAYRGVPSKSISFSSYPGNLASVDDFYVTDTRLGIMETTLVVFNTTMYAGNVRPTTLLYWVRVMVTSRLAVDGGTWVQTFARENSGTYNNQWMVVDLKKFTPLTDVAPGTLWIAEQFPGTVGLQDVSGVLQYGYWPSYNVPSMPELFVLSGYGEAVEKQGYEMNDYQRCVRAQIFRRDQGKVHDMTSFQFMMQYNNYQTDPISQGNPLYAISSRGDLDPTSPTCFGAIDVKASSYSLMAQGKRTVQAYSGPTPQQATFAFSTTKATDCGSIKGIPNTFNFTWVTFTA